MNERPKIQEGGLNKMATPIDVEDETILASVFKDVFPGKTRILNSLFACAKFCGLEVYRVFSLFIFVIVVLCTSPSDLD